MGFRASTPIPKYKVLTHEGISQRDKNNITAAVALLFTGKEAETFAQGEQQNGWSFVWHDLQGRVGILRYKGIEVALFINRQITEWESGQFDPTPDGILTDPIDSWARMDLLGPSARQVRRVVANQKKQMEDELKLQKDAATAAEALADAAEREAKSLKLKVDDLNQQLAKWKQKVVTTKSESLLVVVTELMPLLNSIREGMMTYPKEIVLWSMLYSMIGKVVKKFGGVLIEPKFGDVFNPHEHEAVKTQKGQDGKILDVLSVGLNINNRVINAAKVTVGKR